MFLGEREFFYPTHQETRDEFEGYEKEGKIMIHIISNSIDIPPIFSAICRHLKQEKPTTLQKGLGNIGLT